MVDCTPYFSLYANAPAFLEPCTWLHYIQFSGIIVGIDLAIGLVLLLTLIAIFIIFRNKKIETDLTIPLVITVVFMAILAAGIIAGDLMIAVPTVQTTPEAIRVAQQVEKRFATVAKNTTNLLTVVPAVNATFWPFLGQIIRARNASKTVRTLQGPIDVQLRQVKDDVSTTVFEYSEQIVATNNQLENTLANYHDVNIQNVIAQPYNLNLIVPIDKITTAVNDTLIPLWFNHVMAGVSMQAVLDELVNGSTLLLGRPVSSLHNLNRSLEIMHQVIDNLNSTSHSAHDLLEHNVEQAVPAVTITLAAVICTLCALLICCSCCTSLPALKFRTEFEPSKLSKLASASFFVNGCCLVIFSVVFAAQLFLFMMVLPYCSNGGNDIINPRYIPQDYRMEHPLYTDYLNTTWKLLQCGVNGTMMDATMYVYEDLRTNSFVMPQFAEDVEHGLLSLQPIGIDAFAFQRYALKVQQLTGVFNSDIDMLKSATSYLSGNITSRLHDPVNDLKLYEKDNNISFDNFTRLVDDINAITYKIELKFTIDNASSFTPEIIHDVRFTTAEQASLQEYYNQVQPMIPTLAKIRVFQTMINNWIQTQNANIMKTANQIHLNQLGMEHLEELETHLQHPYGDELKVALNAISSGKLVENLKLMKAMKESTLAQSDCQYLGDFAASTQSQVCNVVYPGVLLSFVSSGCLLFLIIVAMILSVFVRGYQSDEAQEKESLLDPMMSSRGVTINRYYY